jgi:hypothetical protein
MVLGVLESLYEIEIAAQQVERLDVVVGEMCRFTFNSHGKHQTRVRVSNMVIQSCQFVHRVACLNQSTCSGNLYNFRWMLYGFH